MAVIIIHGPFESDAAANEFARRHFASKGDNHWDLDVLKSPRLIEQQKEATKS